MSMQSRKHPYCCRGIALIAVLWVCALLAVLAVGFSSALRSEAQLNAAVVDRIRAGTGAEAGMQRALSMLSMARKGGDLSAPLQHYTLHFDDLLVRVELASEAGKIDLNAAPKALMSGLLQRAALAVESLDSVQAQALTEAILDWRDADARVRGQGAERPQYRARGLAGPRDQAFLSVSELRQVMGMNRQIYAFISPLVSVATQSSRIDPRAAARDTLLAVPDLDEKAVDDYLASRLDGSLNGGLNLLRKSKYLRVPARTRTYSITVRASTTGGVKALRRAVIRLNNRVAAPITILDWSRFSHSPDLGQNKLSGNNI